MLIMFLEATKSLTSMGWAGPISAANWDLAVLWLRSVALYWLLQYGIILACRTVTNN